MATVLIKRLLIQWTRRLNTLICCFSEADISSESFIISFELSSTKHEVKLRSYMAVTYAKINRLNSCEKKSLKLRLNVRLFGIRTHHLFRLSLIFFWLRLSNISQLNQFSYFPFQFALKQFQIQNEVIYCSETKLVRFQSIILGKLLK